MGYLGEGLSINYLMFFFHFDDIVSSLNNHIENIRSISNDFKCKDALIAYLTCLREELVSNNVSSEGKQKIISLNSYISAVLDKKKLQDIDLERILDVVKDILQQINTNDANYNTETFYRDEIDRLSKQLQKYQKEIDNFKQENDDKKNLEEKFNIAHEQIIRYEQEIEQNRKREDAINNWKEKITKAFQDLKEPLNRLQKEHDRLKVLYKIYGFTSIVLVLFLVFIEFIVCYKINNSTPYPTWEQYWAMILPVPVAIGLLWGFITQMNRSQRQMVVLARQIYEVEYIEGLLQALNTLSVDIAESMSKINKAISRLIDNHLRNMDSMHIDETTLQKLEKQDALPYEKIPELIKLLKDK